MTKQASGIGSYAERNVRFGVREHGMGAIANGMALHKSGLIPYTATFFIFTDYMRAAIRMSALSEAGVIYVMTHDSIGLGEDGPTHQVRLLSNYADCRQKLQYCKEACRHGLARFTWQLPMLLLHLLLVIAASIIRRCCSLYALARWSCADLQELVASRSHC